MAQCPGSVIQALVAAISGAVKSEVDGAGRLVLDLSAQANGEARAYAQFYEVASCYTCSTCGKMGARIDAVTTPYGTQTLCDEHTAGWPSDQQIRDAVRQQIDTDDLQICQVVDVAWSGRSTDSIAALVDTGYQNTRIVIVDKVLGCPVEEVLEERIASYRWLIKETSGMLEFVKSDRGERSKMLRLLRELPVKPRPEN